MGVGVGDVEYRKEYKRQSYFLKFLLRAEQICESVFAFKREREKAQQKRERDLKTDDQTYTYRHKRMHVCMCVQERERERERDRETETETERERETETERQIDRQEKYSRKGPKCMLKSIGDEKDEKRPHDLDTSNCVCFKGKYLCISD